MHVSAASISATAVRESLHEKINARWHKPALWVFMIVVLAHWAEHIAQGWQVYVMGWPRHHAGGLLGLYWPWLVHTEVLHYGYALVMLIGIWMLRKGFAGRSRAWWSVALAIQFWHHFEHLLLIGQATFHHNLFGSSVPTSIVQQIIPRIELHLFYNSIVFIPMVIGMYYHMFPAKGEAHHAACNCAWHRRSLAA
jgi:hypothetical protein